MLARKTALRMPHMACGSQLLLIPRLQMLKLFSFCSILP
ncbi:hypothetical protein RLDS_11695 [Sphingobium lactosutens DS20]|uniref:Uncharacterized protein n=1 Tax=Sphingobium lactosutens DS20 TaxID=1331060 RepID=T0ISP8_9SPHN|nr:hypothetical protein RLDS_11695 [Sphingobium lactosutens DS20]